MTDVVFSDVHRTVGLSADAAGVFARSDFMAWLNDESKKTFTWHDRSQKMADEWSDVIVLVDANYEGDSSDMPEDVWRAICDLAYSEYGGPELPQAHGAHVRVQLTNVRSERHTARNATPTGSVSGMAPEMVRALRKGTLVTLLEATSGNGADDREHSYPIGTQGEIAGVRMLPAPQGLAVTVIIGPQDGEEAIVNVFDEADPCFPLALASPVPVVVDDVDDAQDDKDVDLCGWTISVVPRENGDLYLGIVGEGDGQGWIGGEIPPLIAAVLARRLAKAALPGLERVALMLAPNLAR